MPPLPLIAESLTKVIGRRTIVESVSFELQPGEVFGFLGPNGAGKTTTIRMLVGLIRPTSGRVFVCGHDVQRDFEAAMRCIGCIVETPDLYRFMTGRENLEHFSRMLGTLDRSQIERVASIVSLEHRLDDRVRTYSLGMRQRLGIAQALLGSPRLLILDEPANGLDPAGIREMRELLKSLAHERQMTVFVSSHLLAEIELMCERVAIINHGRIIQVGSIAELVAATRQMVFRVSRPGDAAAIIESLGHRPTVIDHSVSLVVDDDAIPPIVASLTRAGIDTYRVEPRVRSLEEMFLEATGHETVE
jgi:ABC-2 type transport system ATP-binding protein